MHAVFMLHGKKELVDKFIHWLETRMFFLPFKNPKKNPIMKTKEGKIIKEGVQSIDGVLRYGLFGTWEYVFPKEAMDIVLTTLNFNIVPYGEKKTMKARLFAIRKALALKPIPEFKTDQELLLPNGLKEYISIIPLGVRYDEVRELPNGLIHEAL